MAARNVPKVRPYWHVDAKWISGLLLLLVLTLTFLLLGLHQLTTAERGITLLTGFLASAYSPTGMDDAGGLEQVHMQIAAAPNGEWQPIPGLDIKVREADISGLSPRQARLWFFRQLAEPLYYEGAAGLARLATGDETRAGLAQGVGPLGVISAQTHRQAQLGLMISGAAALLLFGLLIAFSYRFGRLGSPGCVLFLAAVPGLLLFTAARAWLDRPLPALDASGENELELRFTQIAQEAFPKALQFGWQLYAGLVLLGLGLMMVALVFSIIWRPKPKNLDSPALSN